MIGSVGTAALLVFTCIWTLPVVKRLPGDVQLLRGDDPRPAKIAVVAVWGLTAILVTWSLGALVGIAGGIASAF